MIIYSSTQYVDPKINKEWYSLEVVNKWDWKTKSICYSEFSGNVISYCLYKNKSNQDSNSYKRELIKEPTEEMKTELVKMGYLLK
jgi:hypothetical protein